jgi:PA domain
MRKPRSYSRRQLMQLAASASTLALTPFGKGATLPDLKPNLLPTRKEVWAWQVWMAKLGPKYTGNPAHRTFVDFLETNMKSTGLEVSRDHFKFARWDAHKWGISVSPAAGKPFEAPVTSYFPYSGQTPATGVTGELVYAGSVPKFDLSGDLKGKIVLIDCPISPRTYSDLYKVWGLYTPDVKFPTAVRAARSSVSDLTPFQKAGALGVILVWTDVSDANAAYQYAPFSRPLQNMPGLWVGHETGAKLRSLAGSGAKATLILDAELIPETATDTLIATLPGSSSDEVIIVNTHTDGPNATEENGALGILALAKYFARIPQSERKRTLVFVMTTGHFAGPYVPSIRGVITAHPDLIKKAVAALTVEHLGCREWADDASLHYKATGENQLSVCITLQKATADIMLESLQGSLDRRAAVVNPSGGGFFGEGSALSRAGIPTIGYIPMPDYLLAGPPDGCIDKLNPELMHSQIEVFAKVIHKMDSMSAAQLKA